MARRTEVAGARPAEKTVVLASPGGSRKLPGKPEHSLSLVPRTLPHASVDGQRHANPSLLSHRPAMALSWPSLRSVASTIVTNGVRTERQSVRGSTTRSRIPPTAGPHRGYDHTPPYDLDDVGDRAYRPDPPPSKRTREDWPGPTLTHDEISAQICRTATRGIFWQGRPVTYLSFFLSHFTSMACFGSMVAKASERLSVSRLRGTRTS